MWGYNFTRMFVCSLSLLEPNAKVDTFRGSPPERLRPSGNAPKSSLDRIEAGWYASASPPSLHRERCCAVAVSAVFSDPSWFLAPTLSSDCSAIQGPYRSITAISHSSSSGLCTVPESNVALFSVRSDIDSMSGLHRRRDRQLKRLLRWSPISRGKSRHRVKKYFLYRARRECGCRGTGCSCRPFRSSDTRLGGMDRL